MKMSGDCGGDPEVGRYCKKSRVMGNVCCHVVQRKPEVNAVEVAVRFKEGRIPLYPLASSSAVGEKQPPQGRARFWY